MNLKTMMTKAVDLTGFKLKKVGPDAMVIGGIVGVSIATYMLFKKAGQLEDILDEHKDMTDEIRDTADEKSRRKEMAKAYAKTGKKIVVAYGPAISVYTLSVFSIFEGHHLVRKRYLSAVAACKVLESSFNEYRDRVKKLYGEEKEFDIFHGIDKKDISVTQTDENGKEKEKKLKNAKIAPDAPSLYARYFDESSPCWEPNPEFSLMFLKAQENYFNELLQIKGYVFLNDVYEALGLSASQTGQLVGWVKGNGDDYIDFGIYNLYHEKHRDFVNGYENVILLDFNVDGIIVDKI